MKILQNDLLEDERRLKELEENVGQAVEPMA